MSRPVRRRSESKDPRAIIILDISACRTCEGKIFLGEDPSVFRNFFWISIDLSCFDWAYIPGNSRVFESDSSAAPSCRKVMRSTARRFWNVEIAHGNFETLELLRELSFSQNSAADFRIFDEFKTSPEHRRLRKILASPYRALYRYSYCVAIVKILKSDTAVLRRRRQRYINRFDTYAECVTSFRWKIHERPSDVREQKRAIESLVNLQEMRMFIRWISRIYRGSRNAIMELCYSNARICVLVLYFPRYLASIAAART